MRHDFLSSQFPKWDTNLISIVHQELKLYLISGLKTYFICGRVSPALNPVESKPSMIGSGKNLVLHTDAINEMAQVSKVEKI